MVLFRMFTEIIFGGLKNGSSMASLQAKNKQTNKTFGNCIFKSAWRA